MQTKDRLLKRPEGIFGLSMVGCKVLGRTLDPCVERFFGFHIVVAARNR